MANPFRRKSPFDDPSSIPDYGSTAKGSAPHAGPGEADPRFVRMQQQIADACMNIRTQTNELRQLLGDIGTNNDDEELRRQITKLRQSAFQQVTETSQLLNVITVSYASSGDTAQEMAIRSLQRQFSQIADEFSHVYEEIVNKLQEHPRPVIMHSLRDSRGYRSSGEMDMEGEHMKLTRADALQQEQEYMAEEASYAENQAREIRELQESMAHLQEIMTLIQQNVAEQEEVVDKIETNVDATAKEVSQGNQELALAVRYKRRNRKLTCVITIICLIILAVIVIVIVTVVCTRGSACHSGGSSPTTTPTTTQPPTTNKTYT